MSALELLREASRAKQIAEHHRIVVRAGQHAYGAWSPEGSFCLLVPLVRTEKAVGRTTGGVRVGYQANVTFDVDGKHWEQPAAVVMCTNEAVLDAFVVLAADMATRLDGRPQSPTWPEVLAAFEPWEQLLQRRRMLGPEEELGLWGELWVMSAGADVDKLLAGWQLDDQAIDFFAAGTGVEVKTTLVKLRHHVSWKQAEGKGDAPVFVLSLYVGTDNARGLRLGELVEGLRRRLKDETELFRKLLAVGYSPADVGSYERKLVALEVPRVYPREDIPTVRTVDPGVLQVRYVVQLEASRALAPSRVAEVLAPLGLGSPTFEMGKGS